MKTIIIPLILVTLLTTSCRGENMNCKIAKRISEGDIEGLNSYLQKNRNGEFVCSGESLLSIAARSRNGYEAAKILLSAGALPNTVDASGSTPLHEAVMWADKSLVELLVEHGASPLQKDFNNATPLDLARSRGDKYGVEIYEYLKTKTGADGGQKSGMPRNPPQSLTHE